jgi:hypothetical protein
MRKLWDFLRNSRHNGACPGSMERVSWTSEGRSGPVALFSPLAAVLAAGAILAAIMVAVPQTPLNAQGKGGGKNGPPKNLKVLTPENLMAQMQTFPAALGVENQGGCNFCHEADRSLDTKPAKVKARQMIELVTEINAKFGDGKVHVTCWTCHLGSTMPEIARKTKL